MKNFLKEKRMAIGTKYCSMGATIFEGEFRYGYKYGYFTEFNYKILHLEE